MPNPQRLPGDVFNHFASAAAATNGRIRIGLAFGLAALLLSPNSAIAEQQKIVGSQNTQKATGSPTSSPLSFSSVYESMRDIAVMQAENAKSADARMSQIEKSVSSLGQKLDRLEDRAKLADDLRTADRAENAPTTETRITNLEKQIADFQMTLSELSDELRLVSSRPVPR